MSEKHKCCGRINQGYSSYACGKNAKVERDGKWYCGTHDPVARAEKDAARNAKWNAEWDEKHRIHKMSDLAKKIGALYISGTRGDALDALVDEYRKLEAQ